MKLTDKERDGKRETKASEGERQIVAVKGDISLSLAPPTPPECSVSS